MEEKEKKKVEGRGKAKWVTSITALAKACEMSRPTLYNHMEKPGFPGGRDAGRWDVTKVLAFVLAERRKAEERTGTADPVDQDELRRTRRAKRMILEEKLLRMRADVAPVEAILSEAAFMGEFFAGCLDALKGRISAEIKDRRLLSALERIIPEIRNEVADQCQAVAERILAQAQRQDTGETV